MNRETGKAAGLSRRRLLATGASAVAAASAGCAGGVLGLGDETPTFLDFAVEVPHEEMNFNPFGRGYPSQFSQVVFDTLAVDVLGQGVQPDALAAFAVDESGSTPALEARLPEDWTWWSGGAVTAADLAVGHQIDRLLAAEADRRFASVETVDDHTVRFTWREGVNAELAVRSFLVGARLDTPRWRFAAFRDRLREATTASERDAVRQDLSETWIGTAEVQAAGLGNGPYRIDSRRLGGVIFVPHEGYHRPEATSVASVRLARSSTNTFEGRLAEGRLDAGRLPLPDHVLDALPDGVEVRGRHRRPRGYKLAFNWRNPHLAQRGVRRAVAAALDVPALLDDSGLFGVPVRHQTGMGSPRAEARFAASFLDGLYRYPADADHDLAASFMREAGYHRTGGEWVHETHGPVTFQLIAPLINTWNTLTRNVRDQLRDFGVGATVNSYERGAWAERVDEGTYGATVVAGGGGPLTAYDPTNCWPSGLGLCDPDPDGERGARGKPIEVTVPETVGALSVEGDGEVVNWVRAYEDVRLAPDDEAIRAGARRLARAWNYEVPDLHLSDAVGGAWVDTDEFAWPADDHPAYRVGDGVAFYLLRQGLIEPREE